MTCPLCGMGPEWCPGEDSHYEVQQAEPAPSEADYCEAGGHAFYGVDSGVGRCWCGARLYGPGHG